MIAELLFNKSFLCKDFSILKIKCNKNQNFNAKHLCHRNNTMLRISQTVTTVS